MDNFLLNIATKINEMSLIDSIYLSWSADAEAHIFFLRFERAGAESFSDLESVHIFNRIVKESFVWGSV